MEEIRDRELAIVGERYRSFDEFYRVNGGRRLNQLYSQKGDGVAESLFEAAPGEMFSPEDTRNAVLYGSDLFEDQFKEATFRAHKLMREKYEWLDEPSFAADTHGQNVIVERFMVNHPKAFHRRNETQRRRRSVNIIYDAMCPASTPVEKRIEAGCSVLASAEALETIGYEVALSFALAKYSGNKSKGDPTLLLEIAMKKYGEPLSSRRLEFPFASKTMLFHVGSWWAHRFPRTPVHYGDGEGYPLSYDKARIAQLKDYAKKRHGVYLSEDIIEVQDASDPVRVLEHVLGAIGEERELIAHMRTSTPMQVAIQPSQGKLFSASSEDGVEKREGGAEKKGSGKSGMKTTQPANQHASQVPTKPNVPKAPDASSWQLGANSSSGPSLSPLAKGEQGANSIGPEKNEGRPATQKPGRTSPEQPASKQGAGTRRASDQSASSEREQASNASWQNEAQDGKGDSQLQSRPASASQTNSNSNSRGQTSQGSQGWQQQGESSDKSSANPAGDQNSQVQSKESQNTSNQQGQQDKNKSESRADRSSTATTDRSAGSMDSDKASNKPSPNESEGVGASAGGSAVNSAAEEYAKLSKAIDEEFSAEQSELGGHSDEDFVVMLRKRFIRFENGDYLKMMVDEKMAKRRAEKARESGVPAAPYMPQKRDEVEYSSVFRYSPLGIAYVPNQPKQNQ